MVSKKQQACVNRYVRKAYDRIVVTVPKGQGEEIQKHAQSKNESRNAFIKRAIAETIKNDQKSS